MKSIIINAFQDLVKGSRPAFLFLLVIDKIIIIIEKNDFFSANFLSVNNLKK